MSPSGPLAGLRIIELSSEMGAWAGRLMAGMGADVILVEPPGGDRTRAYPPFQDDTPHPERSLWFWHYNAGKRGITLDLESPADAAALRQLAAGADFRLESERPGRLAALGLDYADLKPLNDRLIMVSTTPYGREGPGRLDEATDLTILAGGGPVWSTGYDDHSLPPVRGGGNQGYHTVCHFAVQSALVALLYRDAGGAGQHIDVNAHAAANVTTEWATIYWNIAHQNVQRQTGRHAMPAPTQPTQIRCADGRYVNGGVPARNPRQFAVLHEWLTSAGLIERFEGAAILEWAMEGEGTLNFDLEDDAANAKLTVARDAVNFLAANLNAYDFFVGGQARGFQLSVINSPEEALEDPHIKARGVPVQVEHPELGRSYTYAGAPIRFTATPMTIQRRAPLLGEHTAEV
jgi:benzylsuccinate CoA-transferase BbsE subunit